ncbi:hypothetical protein ACFZAT_26360 [Streptomyces sp. NPDC008163]|uniref:non-homologous end-joining DNA ligase LigD n=1 Tax=Streptomyces sp. NPDC008163 TaxID=3364818 RepID=UPI0036E7826D
MTARKIPEISRPDKVLFPDDGITEARKNARGDRLHLDVQRNADAQTAVAPYAVRARTLLDALTA